MSATESLDCIECAKTYSTEDIRYQCDCGGLLTVIHDQETWKRTKPENFDRRKMEPGILNRSGVWRFREAIANISQSDIVTLQEGDTALYRHDRLSQAASIERFFLKHEGQNPSGSFKDRGMTVAVSKANSLQRTKIACASTGNTSAALAAYAAACNLEAIVFIPEGKIALGKLSQAIGYGAKIIQIQGDFDAAMTLVQEAAKKLGIYMVNSLNPFRIEGQKTIIWETLSDLNWEAPDWIVVPAGNLGNTTAFGKAIEEAFNAGWIKKRPRIASVQASGANPFYTSYINKFASLVPIQAETVATAIRIGNPVNFPKARRVIQDLNGVVIEVSDSEILAAKKIIDTIGIGCEPASACSLAGAYKLHQQGIINSEETVVGILTGHILKDSEILLNTSSTSIQKCKPELSAIEKLI